MLPSIPNRFSQLIVFICFIMIGFSYYLRQTAQDKYNHFLLYEYSDKNAVNYQNDAELVVLEYDSKIAASYFRRVAILSLVILTFAGYYWTLRDDLEKKIALRSVIDKPQISTYCNTCCNDFDSYFIKYGTENNGDFNYLYCINCYKNGIHNQAITYELILTRIKSVHSVSFSDWKNIWKLFNNIGVIVQRSKLIMRLENADRWRQRSDLSKIH